MQQCSTACMHAICILYATQKFNLFAIDGDILSTLIGNNVLQACRHWLMIILCEISNHEYCYLDWNSCVPVASWLCSCTLHSTTHFSIHYEIVQMWQFLSSSYYCLFSCCNRSKRVQSNSICNLIVMHECGSRHIIELNI